LGRSEVSPEQADEGGQIRRRDFIGVLGTAVAAPLLARADQAATPVIGFLNGASRQGYAPYLAGFLQGLSEAGYREGQNVAIEYSWAEGDYDRLQGLAADLVRHQVAVLVANTPAAPFAKAATASIPIVFIASFDPVAHGLVPSIGHPGGNVTGVSLITSVLAPKQMGLLHELNPAITSIALLMNPGNPNGESYANDAQTAAQALGQQLHILSARTATEIDAAFATLPALHPGALILGPDGFLIGRRDQVVALIAPLKLPTLAGLRDFAAAGGLMSYGPSLVDQYRQAGVYAGKILSGAKPADLPVLQPTKFEFVLNLRAAKALGITFPPSLFARADEVIE
jgi:putative tryptophan/tyrosine transport system substrate-binding protein